MVNNKTVSIPLTKGELIILAFLTGQLVKFMDKEEVDEVSIGYQQVAGLFDKLSKVVTATEEG